MAIAGVESHDNIFANAHYVEIYFKVGRFDDGSRGDKMVKAPFALLHISTRAGTNPKTMYLEPRGFGGDISGVRQDAGHTYQLMLANQGMGWNNGNHMVLDPAEMGDTSDGWRGLHEFSFI